jgi:hypothetical protein
MLSSRKMYLRIGLRHLQKNIATTNIVIITAGSMAPATNIITGILLMFCPPEKCT